MDEQEMVKTNMMEDSEENMEAEKKECGKINRHVVEEKYTLIKSLGQGGEGCVYLARDERLQRLVAIKHVHRPKAGRAEADYLQQLRHPMLPVVYDLLGDDDEAWYLVMEYIQGTTLHDYIERNGFVQEEQARVWAVQLTEILNYLHSRKPPVIYSDLKPDNIMVCPDGRLRLVDFGAALTRNFGEAGNKTIAVTPGFGAPEQWGGMKRTGSEYEGTGCHADERSDIYALGMVLYYMVTGADPAKPPYSSRPVCEYQPVIGERLEEIIRKCIRQEPEKRYQTVEEVRRDLERSRSSKYRSRRKSFVRVIERRVWLTDAAQTLL